MPTDETNASGPAPKARKPRQKKWASELARQAHSNQRRRLAREASVRRENSMKQAREDLKRADNRLLSEENNRRLNMVANGLTPRLTAVMNSWGIGVPVKLTSAQSISAWTDFKSIAVQYDRRLTRRWAEDKEFPVTTDALRQIAAETRGLFYHEVGHLLFTVPLNDLLTLAWLEDYRSRSVSYPTFSNKPSLPSKLQHLPKPGEDGAVYPNWKIGNAFHQAWNILEDQRMEAALVEESPQIASYLTVLTLRNMIMTNDRREPSAWGLVAGRKYLPASVRSKARQAWTETYPHLDADKVADVVERYAVAETPQAMLGCIEEMADLLAGMRVNSLDNHSPMVRSSGQPKSDTAEKLADTAEKASKAESNNDESDDLDLGIEEAEEADEDEGFGPSLPGTGGDEDDEADEFGEGGASKADGKESDESDGEPGQQVGGGHDEEGSKDEGRPKDFRDDLNDVLDALDDDQAIDDDVKAMNEAYGVDDGALPTYGSAGPLDDEELIATGSAIVDDLVQAFNIATADCTPHWESGQRRGVLEAIRYRTRQPGDMEFFRQYADDGDPGADIAVSIFLDVSGSMSGSTNALGAAAWASKKACAEIGVDCDVTLFDTQAWRLWAAEDVVDEPVSVNHHGSTNPQAAFDAILADERDKKHHLVLIMTDGEWSDKKVLASHRHSNMRTMVFNYSGYGYGRKDGATPNARMAVELSADEAFDINDLFDIPRALESMLIGLV